MGVSGKTREGGAPESRGPGIALFVAAAVAVCVAVGLWTRANTQRFEIETIGKTQQHLMNTAEAQSHKIEEFIYHVQGELEMLAKNPAVIRYNKENLSQEQVAEAGLHSPGQEVFYHIDKHFEGDVDSYYRIDKEGIVLARVPFREDKIGDDYSHKPGVKCVMENKKPCVSDILTTNSGKQAISVCHPVFDGEEFAGVIRFVVYIETLGDLIGPTKVGEKGYAWLIDDTGTMLAHPNPDHVGKDVIRLRKEAFPDHDWVDMEKIVDRMKAGERGVGVCYSDWWTDEKPELTKKLIAFTPVKVGEAKWSLAVSMGYDEIRAPIAKHDRNNLLGAGFLLALFGAGGVAFYTAEKKKAELSMLLRTAEALEENEQRFRSVAQTASDAVITIDASGTIAFWNDSASRIFGYSTDEVMGRPITLIIPERFRDAHEQGINRLRDTGVPYVVGHTVELAGLRKGGGEFPLELSLAGWQTEEGIFYTGIVRDITDRKLAEEALRESEARLAATLDTMPDMVYESTLEGTIIYANKAASQILGYSLDELGKISYADLLDEEGLATGMRIAQELLEKKRTSKNEFYNLRAADGTMVPVEAHATLMERKGRQPTILGVARDIRERRRAQEELFRIRAAVDNATDAIMITDGQGKAVYLNEAFGHLFGHTIESINQAGTESIYVEQSVSHEVLDRVHSGTTWEGETRMMPTNEAGFPAFLRASPIFDNEFDVIGTLIICTDITERKRSDAEQLERQKLQAIVELAGAACHELNQPIQVISGHTELMLMRMSKGDSLRGQLETIAGQVRRMVRITRKLGNITSYETRSYFDDIRIIDIEKASENSRNRLSSSDPAHVDAKKEREKVP